jgi:phosphate transport system permease protein
MVSRTYFKGLEGEKVISGFAVLAGAGLFASYGIVILFKVLAYSATGALPWGTLPFTDTFASLLWSILYLFAAALLFLAGYSVMESHYVGIAISSIIGLYLVAASMLGQIDTVLSLASGALCLFGAIVGFSAKKKSRIVRTPARVVEENLFKVCLRLAGLIAVGSLFTVIAVVFIRGAHFLSWSFLINGTPPGVFQEIANILGGFETGVFGVGPAIVGSFLVCGVCELTTIPLGLGSAIYLAEYTPRNIFTRIIHFFVELLAGIPSIILGIFGFTFFFYSFGWAKQSLLGGALCLAFMTLPWNIRVTEEAIKTVPDDFKAASYALGATKLQTIRRIVLEVASPGILTGILLGFGAAFGEAAVVLFAAGNAFYNLPDKLSLTNANIPTLPAWIYQVFRGETTNELARMRAQDVAFAGSFVLIAIFLAITVVALLVRNRLRKKLGVT